MNFNIQTFFKIAMVIFVIIGASSIYTLVHYWPLLDVGEIIGKIAGIFFNFLLAYLFFWQLGGSKLQTDLEMKTNDEILKLMEKET